MNRRITLCLTVLALAGLLSPLTGRAQLPFARTGVVCLHDSSSLPEDRARREQARALVRAIHAAEGRAAQVTREYLPLGALPGLPDLPDGFQLRLYTDTQGYLVSLKDGRDPCHYGIFSDEHGRLYEMTPQVPLIAS